MGVSSRPCAELIDAGFDASIWAWLERVGVTFDVRPPVQSDNVAHGGEAVKGCVEVDLLHPLVVLLCHQCHCVPFGIDQAVLYYWHCGLPVGFRWSVKI